MEGAVGWEESGGFKGYFGDCWDMDGACVEGKRTRGVQVPCGWVAVGHPWGGDVGERDVGMTLWSGWDLLGVRGL